MDGPTLLVDSETPWKELTNMCCLICTEWQLGKLTNEEAMRNLMESYKENDQNSEENIHYLEALEKVLDKDVPFEDTDIDLDYKWYQEQTEE